MYCDEKEDSERDLTSLVSLGVEGSIGDACKVDECCEAAQVEVSSSDTSLDGDALEGLLEAIGDLLSIFG